MLGVVPGWEVVSRVATPCSAREGRGLVTSFTAVCFTALLGVVPGWEVCLLTVECLNDASTQLQLLIL